MSLLCPSDNAGRCSYEFHSTNEGTGTDVLSDSPKVSHPQSVASRVRFLNLRAALMRDSTRGEDRGQGGQRPGGDGAFLGVTPLGLLTSQSPGYRPWEQAPARTLKGQSPPFSAVTICTPSCSAPCKAFSLNSLPFSRRAAAHICGNQATATPPTTQQGCAALLAMSQASPLLPSQEPCCPLHTTCYFQDSAYREGHS